MVGLSGLTAQHAPASAFHNCNPQAKWACVQAREIERCRPTVFFSGGSVFFLQEVVWEGSDNLVRVLGIDPEILMRVREIGLRLFVSLIRVAIYVPLRLFCFLFFLQAPAAPSSGSNSSSIRFSRLENGIRTRSSLRYFASPTVR